MSFIRACLYVDHRRFGEYFSVFLRRLEPPHLDDRCVGRSFSNDLRRRRQRHRRHEPVGQFQPVFLRQLGSAGLADGRTGEWRGKRCSPKIGLARKDSRLDDPFFVSLPIRPVTLFAKDDYVQNITYAETTATYWIIEMIQRTLARKPCRIWNWLCHLSWFLPSTSISD